MYSYGPPHLAGQKQDHQHEHTFSSYVRIQDVALKTCQRRWTIGKSGERGSGISVLSARHNDDDCRYKYRFYYCKVDIKLTPVVLLRILLDWLRSGKGLNPLSSQLLFKKYHYCSSRRMAWYKITYEGWYTIKQRNQTQPNH